MDIEHFIGRWTSSEGGQERATLTSLMRLGFASSVDGKTFRLRRVV